MPHWCQKWDSKSMATILKEEEELRKIEELITHLEAVNGAQSKKRGDPRAAASQPGEDLWGLPDGASHPRPLGSCRSRQGMLQAPRPRATSQPPLMVMPGSSTPSLLAAEGDNANCLQDQVQPPLPSGAPVRGSMKLPRYNGEAPPETYLIQVQLAAQLNGWSTEETAVQVALALEGRALQILTDLQPEERLSWPAVARAMQSRFGLRTHADDARDKLANRPRRQEESLGAYAADLRLYARRGYPAFDAAAQEELALQAFVRGLQPKRLQEHIRLHAPETLAAALTEAERVEHVLSPGARSPGISHQVRQTDYERSDQAEEARQTTNTPPWRSRRGNRRAGGQSRGNCHRCGEPGHIARYCPAPSPQSLAPQLPLN